MKQLSASKIREVKRVTKRWLEEVIIGLNICPFAKSPFEAGKIRLTVADSPSMEALLRHFLREIEHLEQNDSVETTLIMLPILGKMEHFRAYVEFCEDTIKINDLQKVFQVVSFHPQARMQGVAPNSGKNLTMMAPYPTLHILRAASVEALGKQVKKDVQNTNDQRLSKINPSEVLQIWQKILG